LALGRAYSVGSKPESENPLPQAYVEARHTLQVSPYNLSVPILFSHEDEIDLAAMLTAAKSY
jgi:hypothetical protein